MLAASWMVTASAMISATRSACRVSVSAAAGSKLVAKEPGAARPRPPIDGAGTTNGGDPWRPCRRPPVRSGAAQPVARARAPARSRNRLAPARLITAAGESSPAARNAANDTGRTSTTQLLKGQTMLNLNEHHRTELSTLRATPIQAPHAARRRTRERIRQIENQSLKSFSRSRRRRSCATLQTASRAALRKSLESRLEARRGDPEGLPVRADEGDV